MQTAHEKQGKKHQWLLVLVLAPLLAVWLGHQAPHYAAGNGEVFQDARHVTWTPATSPMSGMPAAQQKGHHDQPRKQPDAR